MNLPTLFKKTSTGADQEWTIYVEGPTITTRYGQVGGKIQETSDTIKEGKNLGKANATTAEQQAAAEAQSQWEKKLKKGYVQSLTDARAGKVDDVIEGGINPMLAHRFDEQGHKIKFPALAQPKFDGHRCIAMIVDGKATLWSRTRKPITGLPHIIKAVQKLVEVGTFTEDMILDGELYSHSYKDKFEDLSSFIRTPDPKEGHEIVQYHVYDLATENDDQLTRSKQLATVFEKNNSPALVQVETIKVDDEDDMMLAFERFLGQGYEGLMVRNMDGLYVGKRSYDLQKVKEFIDAEFKVVGVEEGRGKLAGHAIFVCVTDKGEQFKAKMKGETIKLKEYFDHPETAIGKLLTVKFQGWTKYNVPRFPVGLRFKEEL